MEMEQDDQFVTVVITQVVKPGCESAYEAWLEKKLPGFPEPI